MARGDFIKYMHFWIALLSFSFLTRFSLCGDTTPCYEYRKEISFTQTVSTDPLLEAMVEIDTSSLPLYSASCQDIRFKSNTIPDNFSAANEIRYWFESACPSDKTNIWLNLTDFPLVKDVTRTVYMYAGCETAAVDELSWGGEFVMPIEGTKSCSTPWSDYTLNAAHETSTLFFVDDGGDFGYQNVQTQITHDHELNFKIASDTSSASIKIGAGFDQVYETTNAHGHDNSPGFAHGGDDIRIPKYREVGLCTSTKLDWQTDMIGMFDGTVPGTSFTETNDFDDLAFRPISDPNTDTGGDMFPTDETHVHTFVDCAVGDLPTKTFATQTNITAEALGYPLVIADQAGGSDLRPVHDEGIDYGGNPPYKFVAHEHCLTGTSETGKDYPSYYTLNFAYSDGWNTLYDEYQVIMATEKPLFGWTRESFEGRLIIGGSNGSTGGTSDHNHTLTTVTVNPPHLTALRPGNFPGVVTISSAEHTHTGYVGTYNNMMLDFDNLISTFSTSFYKRTVSSFGESYGPLELLRVCEDGYIGETCDIPICYGIYGNDSSACSGSNGTCSTPNNCTCLSDDYFGHECETWYCFAHLANETGVCSENGTCNSPHSCICGVYVGAECERWECDGDLNNDTSNVCSGNGTCNSPEECICPDYEQPYCANWKCGNFLNSNSDACSSNGTCNSPDFCVCGDYKGKYCDNWVCDGILANDSSVCSSNGTCNSPEECICPEYELPYCANWRCGGVLNNNSDVCSTNGTCNSPDFCICGDYVGKYCDNWECDGILANISSVCSTNGTCNSPEECICPDYVGKYCDNWECDSILANVSDVCSGNGTCNSPEVCICPDYEMPICANWKCGSYLNTNSDACSTNGTCNSPDFCVCGDYVGKYCDNWECGGILANKSDVCTGNGTCISPEECICPDYESPYCQNWKCGDLLNNDTEVCSNNGTCNSPGKCICPDYFGAECQFWDFWKCFGYFANETNHVCSGNGTCISTGQCFCPDYFGDECEFWKCFGFFSNDTENVCSGNGSCVAPDVCHCPDYEGNECETWKCFEYFQNDTKNVCSEGNGTCISPDHCFCEIGFYGKTCLLFNCSGVDFCSSNGNCTAPNECDCHLGYYYDSCDGFNCSGVSDCSSHGTCSAPDTCNCHTDYYDVGCAGFNCTGVNNCSEHGLCFSPDVCNCSSGFYNFDCASFDCDGVPSTQSESCNVGICFAPNICNCSSHETGYEGKFCDIPICDPGFCVNNSTCIAPNRCHCLKHNVGRSCSVHVCNNVPSNRTDDVCRGRGKCANGVCKCKPGNAGVDCEINLMNLWNSAEQIVGYVGGGLGVVLFVVGVIIVFVFATLIIIRRLLKVRNKRIIHTDSELSKHVETGDVDLPENEKKRRTSELAKQSNSIIESIKIGDNDSIQRVSRKFVSALTSLRKNIWEPNHLFVNIIEGILHPSFDFLEIQAQVGIVRMLERLIGLVVVYFPKEKIDIISKHEEDIVKKFNGMLARQRGGKDIALNLKMELQLSLEGIKNVNKNENDFAKIFATISNVKNVSMLFREAVSEYKKLAKVWYAKVLVMRILSYYSFSYSFQESKNVELSDSLKSLLSMIPMKWKKVNILHLLGIVHVLGELIENCGHCEKVLETILNGGEGKYASLLRFIHVDIDEIKHDHAVELRTIGLEIIQGMFQQNLSQNLVKQCKSILFHRVILETEKDLREKIAKIQQSAIDEQSMKTMVKEDTVFCVKKMNSSYTNLQNQEMFLERQMRELEERNKMRNILLEELREIKLILQLEEKRKEYLVNVEKKKMMTADIVQWKKELKYLREDLAVRNMDESELAKMKDLKEKVNSSENSLFELENRIGLFSRNEKQVKEKEKEISELEKETESREQNIKDSELEFKKMNETYSKQKENLEQIKRDYLLALSLQQDEIEEKNKRLEEIGNSSGEEVEQSQLEKHTMQVISDEEEYDTDVPKDFICPITREVMIVPVTMMESGITYEKEAIECWLLENDTDPVSKKKLTSKKFTVSYMVKNMIEEWKMKHKKKIEKL